MSKKRLNISGLVYSTDPNFKIEKKPENNIETPLPSQQNLKIRLDAKQRVGKVVKN